MKSPTGARTYAVSCAIVALHVLFCLLLLWGMRWEDRYDNFVRWDANWYVRIARVGYRCRVPELRCSLAFLPAFPSLSRPLGILLSDFRLSTTIVAQFFAAVLWVFFIRMLPQTRRYLFVGLAISFPSAFYLVVPYAESVFVASMLGCIYFVERERWGLAGGWGALALGTRMFGLALPLTLVGTAGLFWAVRDRTNPPRFRANLLVASLSTVVLLGFFAFCYFRFGIWNAYFRAQAFGWNVHPGASLLQPPWRWTFDLEGLFHQDSLVPAFDRSVTCLTAWVLSISLVVETWLFRTPTKRSIRRVRFLGLAVGLFVATIYGLNSHRFNSMTRYLLPVYLFWILWFADLRARFDFGRWSPVIDLTGTSFALASGFAQFTFAKRFLHAIWVG